MNKKIKIFSLFTGICMSMSVLASCNADRNDNGEDNGGRALWKGRGVHTARVEPTNEYVVKDGETDYVLLLPASPTEYEEAAATLINEYMHLSLGVTFPVRYSNGTENTTTGKYVSLGDTSLMRRSGISIDVATYGSSGFKIVTKGDDIYVSGARNSLRAGTYYGAQDFLKHTIGWKAYALDEVKYEVLSDLKLFDFEVTEIPEFDSRRVGVKNLTENLEYQRYMRTEIITENRLDYSGHSHFEVLPISEYEASHSKWYVWENGYDANSVGAEKHGQLCLTNEEMTQEFIKQVAADFKAKPEADFAHLGQQDNELACHCVNCEAVKAKYNTNDAGLMVMFTNKVARGVTKIIQEDEPDRQLQFEMFAYLGTIVPPTHKEGDKYVADCNEVIPDENVIVQFTPLGANASETMDSQENVKYYSYLQGWRAICDNISVWTYNTNFHWLVFNHKNWDTMTADMRMYSDMGVRRFYNQGSVHYSVAQMTEMRIFIESSLMWNSSLNFQELVEEFIAQYYGPAAPYIQQAYDAMTTYYEYINTDLGLSGSVYIPLNDEKYWSFGYVESIRRLMEKAYESIAYLQETDKATYEKYYWRVGSAYMENLFMQMEYYKENYGKEYSLKAIDLFEDISQRLNVSAMNESSTNKLSSYVSKWRAAYA